MDSVYNKIKHRKLLLFFDLAGYALGSIAITLLAFANKRTSDAEVTYDYFALLLIFGLFASTYVVVFATKGNAYLHGFIILLMTSVIGSLLYICISIIWVFFLEAGNYMPGFGSFLGIFFVLFWVSLNSTVVVRIVSLPIVLIVEARSRSFIP